MALTKISGSILKDPLNLGGEVSIGGTLTYQDVTNVDAIGIITARAGVNVSGGQVSVGAGTSLHSTGLDLGAGNITGHNLLSTGIITATSFYGDLVGGSVFATSGAFTGNIDLNSDINKLKIGAGDDFQFYHNGSNNFIETNNGDIRIKTSDSSGNLTFTAGGSTERARITSTGRIEIGTGTNVFASAPIEVKVSSSSGWTDYPEHISFVDQKAYNASDNGSGIVFSGKYNNSGSVTTFSSIHSKKANTTDGNFGGILTFNTREHGNSNFERMRIDSVGRVFINSVGATTPTADYRSLNIVAHAHSEAAVSFSRSHTLMGSGTTNGKSIILMPDGALSFQTHNVGERLRITNNGKIGINNNDPGGRTGSIDTSSNDSTDGRAFTDLRGHSSLILRNPSTTHHSFTQMSFINGGGTQAATLLRHRLGSSQGSLQNYVGDLCLFRRTGGNGGANNDFRESTRWCGANEQARQVWWAQGDSDTSNTNRLGWHHLSIQRDHPGTDAYSFFRLETGAASYARQGWGKYTCAWTTGHASGYGLATGHFGYYMHHGNSRIYVNEHIIYRERYSNGSYYSWDDAPNLRICNYTQSGGTNAAIVFRVGGRRYSGGYDMGVIVGLFVDLYVPESANGDANPRLYSAGSSQSNLDGGGFGSPVNHDYCTFQSSNPNHGAQP